MCDVFKTCDFYVYLGHGAGEMFFGERELKEIKNIDTSVFLIGCSTNKQTSIKDNEAATNGAKKIEIKGISIDYLLCNWYFDL